MKKWLYVIMIMLTIPLISEVIGSSQEEVVIDRGSNFDTFKTSDGHRITTYYVGAKNMPNSEGVYVPFEDVVNMSWENGAIVYSWYDKEVRLKPLVIYNGNEYTFPEIKQNYPNIDLKGFIVKERGRYKYGLNISSIPDSIKNNIDYIALQLDGATNLGWDDVHRVGKEIYLPNNIRLSFQDLVDSGYTLDLVNKTYLKIGNVSGKNSLWLDPVASYNYTDETNIWAYECIESSSTPPLFKPDELSECNTLYDRTSKSELDYDDSVRLEPSTISNQWRALYLTVNIQENTTDKNITNISARVVAFNQNYANPKYRNFTLFNVTEDDFVLSERVSIPHRTEHNFTREIVGGGFERIINQSNHNITYVLFDNFVGTYGIDYFRFEVTYDDYITVNEPTNATEIYNNLSMYVNVTISEPFNDTIWYNYDGGENVTLNTSGNSYNGVITVLNQGPKNFTFYANDSNGIEFFERRTLYFYNHTVFYFNDTQDPGGKDAYVDSSSSCGGTGTCNFGIRTYLYPLYTTPPDRKHNALMYTNVSSIPSTMTIVSANLSLYSYQGSSSGSAHFPLGIKRITSYWEEGSSNFAKGAVSWVNNTTTTLWTTQGGDFGSNTFATFSTLNYNNIWVSFEINELIQNFVNGTYNNSGFGIVPTESSEGQSRMYSAEYSVDVSKRPYLNITYYSPQSAPTIPTISNPANASTIGYNWTWINFSSTDPNSDTITYHIFFNNTTATLPWNSSTTNEFVNLSLFVDDTYYFQVLAEDGDNNLNSSKSPIHQFRISTSKPAIVLGYPEENQYLNKSTFKPNFTATDADGIDTCNLSHNFTSWHPNQTLKTVSSGTKTNFSEDNYFPNGTFKYNVWCNDTNNNADYALSNFSFTVDTIRPKLTISAPTEATVYTSRTVTLTWATNDTYDNITGCSYNVYQGTTVDRANTTVNCTLNTTSFTVTNWDKNYTVNFYTEDLAQNMNDSSVNFRVELTPFEPGGGGPSEVILAVIGDNCTNSTDCASGLCDLSEGSIYIGTCVNTLCGNTVVDEGETQEGCPQDFRILTRLKLEALIGKEPVIRYLFYGSLLMLGVFGIRRTEKGKKFKNPFKGIFTFKTRKKM